MGQVGVVSSKRLLQTTASKFNINNANWRSDGKEWIGEAIEAIGYHCGFDYGHVQLKVSNYRCVIPSGMETIFYIYHNGIRLPLGVDQSDYGYVRRLTGENPNILSDTEVQDLSKEIDRLNALRLMDVAEPEVTDAIQNSVDKINRLVGTCCLASGFGTYYRHSFYNIDNGYIKTSFDSGSIFVEGRRFKIDEEENLLIINTFKYRNAIEWYLIYRLILQGYSHPIIKDWKQAEAEWEEKMIQAQNEAKMPGMEELERLRIRWNSPTRQANDNRTLQGNVTATW